MAAVNNFDNIAPVYDFMAGVIFGKAIQKAPQAFLDQLPPVQSILVVGGGTGKILGPLTEYFPKGEITYLEPSSKMMTRAKNRLGNCAGQIKFLTAPLEAAVLPRAGYDLIFTPFVLDLFSRKHLRQAMNILFYALKPRGYWMHSDFYVTGDNPRWQQTLVKGMHYFFDMTVHLESKRLKDFDEYFKDYPLQLKGSRWFYFGMIQTVWYQNFG